MIQIAIDGPSGAGKSSLARRLAAALDCGAVTENSTFYCGGHETFNDREQEVSCWKAAGHGMQTTMEAFMAALKAAEGIIRVHLMAG